MTTRGRGESSGPSFLGVLAVALGIGVASAFVFERHGHTCSACGERWRHFGTFNEGDARAHSCPNCGRIQWWKDCPRHDVFPHDDQPAAPAQSALPSGPDASNSRRR